MDTPGPPLPPGPRVNPWQTAGTVAAPAPERLQSLLDGLWRSTGHHRLPDGTVTGIRQRPVPSAGATYPVQTHLVVGTAGLDGLGTGRYVLDHDSGTLLRRPEATERAAGFTDAGEAPRCAGTHLVLTVQPGRSFGRYRHRAWPLWIADVAYAVAAAEFLLPGPAPAVQLGPDARLRRLLGVPPAAGAPPWLARGLVPEIPLAALELPAARTVDTGRGRALARRRSPELAEFAQTPAAARDPRAAGVARLSGQAWIGGAERVLTWSLALDAPAPRILRSLWRAHRRAAALCYDAVLTGRWRCRPVSGIPAGDGRWTVHALAMLSGHTRTTRDGAP